MKRSDRRGRRSRGPSEERKEGTRAGRQVEEKTWHIYLGIIHIIFISSNMFNFFQHRKTFTKNQRRRRKEVDEKPQQTVDERSHTDGSFVADQLKSWWIWCVSPICFDWFHTGKMSSKPKSIDQKQRESCRLFRKRTVIITLFKTGTGEFAPPHNCGSRLGHMLSKDNRAPLKALQGNNSWAGCCLTPCREDVHYTAEHAGRYKLTNQHLEICPEPELFPICPCFVGRLVPKTFSSVFRKPNEDKTFSSKKSRSEHFPISILFVHYSSATLRPLELFFFSFEWIKTQHTMLKGWMRPLLSLWNGPPGHHPTRPHHHPFRLWE